MANFRNALVLFTFILFFSANAYASPFIPGENRFQFINYENLYDADGNQEVSAGDYFYGVAKMTYVEGVDGYEAGAFKDPYYLSYFYLQVEDFVSVGDDVYLNFKTPDSLIDLPDFDTADYFSAEDLADGIVMKWFASSTKLTTGTVDGAFDSVDNGPLWMALSLDEGFWYGKLTDPTGSTLNQNVESNYGLNLVDGYQTPFISQALADYAGNNYNVDFYGIASIYPNPDAATKNTWFFASTDPGYVVATPEPSTMLLLGAGLLGLGALARRRR